MAENEHTNPTPSDAPLYPKRFLVVLAGVLLALLVGLSWWSVQKTRRVPARIPAGHVGHVGIPPGEKCILIVRNPNMKMCSDARGYLRGRDIGPVTPGARVPIGGQ